MTVKKILLIAAVMLVFFAFVGGKTVITMWVYDEMAANEEMELVKAQKEFMERNPTIELKIENVPNRGLMEKFITASLAGVAPDIIHVSTTWAVELGAIGTLLPLNDYISASGKDKEILKSAIDSSTLDGHIYALPWISDATALIINKTAFEKAGINYSRDTAMNWSEFLEVAKKLTFDNQYGFGIRSGRGASYGWFPWLVANGGSLFSPDGTKVTFNEPEGKEAFKFYAELFTTHKVIPPGAIAYDTWDDIRNSFLGGRIAMYIAGDWEIAPLRAANAAFEIDVIPHPMQVRRAASLGGSSLGIWSGSKAKDAAWAWLDFLTSAENMKVAFSYGRFPSRVDALDSGFINDPLIEQFIREFPYGINHASLVGDYSRTVLGDAFTSVLVYGEDPDTALDKAAKIVQEALNEALGK